MGDREAGQAGAEAGAGRLAAHARRRPLAQQPALAELGGARPLAQERAAGAFAAARRHGRELEHAIDLRREAGLVVAAQLGAELPERDPVEPQIGAEQHDRATVAAQQRQVARPRAAPQPEQRGSGGRQQRREHGGVEPRRLGLETDGRSEIAGVLAARRQRAHGIGRRSALATLHEAAADGQRLDRLAETRCRPLEAAPRVAGAPPQAPPPGLSASTSRPAAIRIRRQLDAAQVRSRSDSSAASSAA